MYNWSGQSESSGHKYLGLILFCSSALLALLLFLIFHPQIDAINRESPILINLMFIPAMAVGFLYGIKITQRAVNPAEIRSPIKRSIVKIFLFFFVMANGGATFLIISSIMLMAAATKRIVGLDSGFLNRLVSSASTFVFVTVLALSFTKSDPTSSGIFLYTFYQAGIVGGAFFAMNRLTKDKNMVSDFANGY